ncbi:MAG: hypothetical protein P1V97_35335 [Planctomycetota bacterium]|nr:hypothetical protein [Planctomycetota bacterium]
MEQVLIIVGASIYGLLGTIHLLLTFFSNKFEAFDPAVTAGMKESTLILTRETTVWKAWIGFNGSHSLGAMLIAAFYIPLTLQHFHVIEESLWLTLLPSIASLSYLGLAWKYWFKIPLIGITMASLAFIAAAVIILV